LTIENVLLTALGALAGILATVLAARHYFRRTVNTQLAPYIHVASPVLAGIDPEVKQKLKISYGDVSIDDLTVVQVFIANVGQTAIKDPIEPLSVVIPHPASPLDARVLYVHPAGRDVSTTIDSLAERGARVLFCFQLLNPGEFFLAKLLLHGSIVATELTFRIVAEGLPPALSPVSLPYASLHRVSGWFGWMTIAVGTFSALVGLAFAHALLLLRAARPELFPIPWVGFQLTPLNLAAAILWLAGVVAACGVAWHWIVDIGLRFAFRRPTFQIPEGLSTFEWNVMEAIDFEARMRRFKERKVERKRPGGEDERRLTRA
jgi:hypothetical protein